jgi:hypothetical protein
VFQRVLFFVFVAGALIRAPAAAFRIEFEVTHNGVRVEGAEVCFQPARSMDESYARWFSSSQLRCLPADQVLDFPVGQWNYFGRHSAGLISANPQLINLEKADEEAGYRKSGIVMQPAAAIDVSGIALPVGDSLFLFLANRASTFGSSIHPVPPGASQQLIPADTDVLPIVARAGKPVRLLEPVNAKAGTVAAARERKRVPGTVDVVAWVKLDVPALRKLAKPETLRPFEVRLRRGRTVIAQQFPIRNGAASHLSLVTFVDVPKGKATLELFGADWQPYKQELVLDRDFVVVDEPVKSTPAARIAASWQLPPGSVPVHDTPCKTSSDVARPQVLARLQRCPPEKACELVTLEQRELTESGEILFTGLASGQYTIDAVVGGLRTATVSVEGRAGEETAVEITPEPVVIRGRATRDETVLSAMLRFQRGVARTDAVTGEYTLLLDRPLRADSVVETEPCDGSASRMEVVPVALSHGTVFDLHLRDDAAVVEVFDSRHGRSLSGAAVTYAALAKSGNIAFATRAGETGDDGRLQIKGAPDEPLRVCARASEYEEACIDVPAGPAPRTAQLRLKHVGGRRGRVVSATPVAGGLFYFSAANGQILETVPVKDDATFDCSCDGRAAYVVMISDTHPLLLLPPPVSGPKGEDAVITLPLAPPARLFHVAVAASSQGGRVTLAIDGRLVPLAAVTNHQLKRRLPTIVAPGGNIRVADIAGGQIEVILMPLYEQLPPALSGKDVATLPEWQVLLPRKPIDSSGTVLFE